jgi:hypothetical protein
MDRLNLFSVQLTHFHGFYLRFCCLMQRLIITEDAELDASNMTAGANCSDI